MGKRQERPRIRQTEDQTRAKLFAGIYALSSDDDESNTAVTLSPRECEIIRLVAKDLSNKEIAAVLEISPWTVATHLRHVFAKLGVRSKAAMVACVSELLMERRGNGENSRSSS